MDVAATKLIDRWLQNEDYGVEAHLHQVPRETPEGGTDPLPEMPVVVNDIEDEDVAERIQPNSPIALVVFAETGGEIEFDTGSHLRQIGENIQMVVAYVTHDVPILQARRDCGYVLRAVVRSLTDFNSSRKSRSYRTLNGYKIAQIARVRRKQVASDIGGNSRLWGFVVATLEMIDSEP